MPGVNNYRTLVFDTEFLAALGRTVRFAFFAVAIEFILGYFLAQTLVKPFRGRAFFRTIHALPLMVAPIAVGATWRLLTIPGFGPVPYFLDKWFGIDYNIGRFASHAFLTIVLMDIWHWTPFVTLVLLAGLTSMPIRAFRAGEGGWRQPVADVLLHHDPHADADCPDRVLHPDDGRAARRGRDLDAHGRRPRAATRSVGIHIWRVVFPKTDYGYGSAMSLLVLYFTIVLSWLVYTAITIEARGDRIPMTSERLPQKAGPGRHLCPVDRRVDPGLVADLLALCRVGAFPCGAVRQPHLHPDDLLRRKLYQAAHRSCLPALPENSLIVASLNAVLVTVLAVFATYALSRWRLKGEGSIFFWTITNRMAPPAAFMLPLFLLFTRVLKIGAFSLFDTQIGLILLYCIFNLPFAIWLLKGIMDGIPTELDEAALVDGASLFTVLTKIIVPLAAPGIAICAVLTWVFAWNEYLFAATLTSVNARTVTTGLAEFVTVTGTNWGQMAALSMISLLPALIFLAFVQRYIVAGLTFGAVKG